MKWQYNVINMGCMFKTGNGAEKMIQEKCDFLGKQGWELVSCQSYDMATKFLLIFKKPED